MVIDIFKNQQMRILKRKCNERISELEVRTEEISNSTTEKYKGIKNMKRN